MNHYFCYRELYLIRQIFLSGLTRTLLSPICNQRCFPYIIGIVTVTAKQMFWQLVHVSPLAIYVSGKVFVNGKVVNKAGAPVSDQANVEIIAEIPKYVCR